MSNHHDCNPCFRFLRALQLVMSIICLTLQIISFSVWYSYIQSNDLSDGIESFFKKNNKLYIIKICYISIIFLTIIGTGCYVISFSKLWWNKVNATMDIFYFALWLSSGLANLDPIYNGSSSCKQYVDHDYVNLYDSYQPPWVGTACRTFIVGLAFTFLNAFLFLITLFLTLRLSDNTGVRNTSDAPYSPYNAPYNTPYNVPYNAPNIEVRNNRILI
ncbi:hypothetical protein Glove_140g122 [Diversispora epigaea]|uniref:MARVEL domain-containing protein n=1 Tax=Diversispora epigaea TaxID=1348612 RepID=A0A397J4J0_9GLOM|nr:hypothetical protein Glove_140g122 [Diversispora epigaea]